MKNGKNAREVDLNPQFEEIRVERGRGLVWVCDVARSSSYLNDDDAADDLEEFLSRLSWVASRLVASTEGIYLKWTGDGFLAWYPLSLHRQLPIRAVDVMDASWDLATIVNVTQLALSPTKRFRLRNAITYEQDGLVTTAQRGSREIPIDVIGRSVTLAFRLASLQGYHPGVATQAEIVNALREQGYSHIHFQRTRLSKGDVLKYFKGERWGTGGVYVSAKKQGPAKTPRGALQATEKLLAKAMDRENQGSRRRLRYTSSFLRYMHDGPPWCGTVEDSYIDHLRKMANLVLEMADLLKKLDRPSGK